jgi:tetratricopeptide (TPR) repeat protein
VSFFEKASLRPHLCQHSDYYRLSLENPQDYLVFNVAGSLAANMKATTGEKKVHMHKKVFLSSICLGVALTGTVLLLSAGAIAQESNSSQPPQEFLEPLEFTKPDPLLPEMPGKRELTPAELEALAPALDQLNAEAAALLQAGKKLQAFNTWNRELRLRRFFGYLAEVEALTRVGNIARKQSQTTEMQLIAQRLQAIQLEAETEAKVPADPKLLQALGAAFVEVAAREQAVGIYQQILAAARASEDMPALEATLTALAQLHFGGLDYSQAAATYEELLVLNQKKSNRTQQDILNEGLYLEKLAFLYDKTEQHQKSLEVREKLLNRYRAAQNPVPVPALKIAMGEDCQGLNRLQQAAQYYQEAYALAWALQQFARAGEALQKLGALYLAQKKPQEALQVYQALLVVQQRGSDFYGLMNTYDQIGTLNLERKAYPQALAAFQKGLEIARQLKYQEDYFESKIQGVSQQRNR